MNANPLRAAIERQLQETQSLATGASPEASLAGLVDLHSRLAPFVEAAKCRLLSTPLDWTDEETAQAGWIYATSHRIAALGFQLMESLRRSIGPDDPRMLTVISLALLYIGEATKWETTTAAKVARDYRSLHALMRRGISTGRQREPLHIEAGGRVRPCTLEALYFRALMLARFASGTLTCKQIEILDEWLWMWAPVLQGVAEAPVGSTLRADLDSGDGLRSGRRANEGPTLYLPQDPIDAAFRALLAEFHVGRIVPSEGCTADFRIEEHVAVIDVIRRGLRTSRTRPATRAQRQATDRLVELYIGLGEITARGFTPAAPRAAAIVLASKDGVARTAMRTERERDLALDEIYDPACRRVTLTNVSETGLGLEGSQADCGALAVGDLVGVRISPSEPLVIGKVMRCIPATIPGRVVSA